MEWATDEQFSTYMSRYLSPAQKTAARMLGDLDEAEDVVQDAFQRIHRDGAPASEPEFRQLLMYRVRRLSKNSKACERRRMARRAAWALELPEMDAGETEAVHLSRIDAESVLRALRDLPEMQRICFRLIVAGERSSEDVAKLCGINGVTARQHAARARRALAARFQSHPQEPNGRANG